jgi:hypothetical protein
VVDDDATTGNCQVHINRQITSSITQISKMQITTYRVEWGQHSKAIQLVNTIHVTRVYDEINILKDVEDPIWETLHTIGQMSVGEHTDDGSVQPTPPSPN